MYFAYFVLQVDSANKQGILLEMVQVLTDLDLVISKSYISSDGGWFMEGQCPPTKINIMLASLLCVCSNVMFLPLPFSCGFVFILIA